MLFTIRTVSGAWINHPSVFEFNDNGELSQRVELENLQHLMQLRKDLGIDLLISDYDWDYPELPMIRVYDDYLE